MIAYARNYLKGILDKLTLITVNAANFRAVFSVNYFIAEFKYF